MEQENQFENQNIRTNGPQGNPYENTGYPQGGQDGGYIQNNYQQQGGQQSGYGPNNYQQQGGPQNGYSQPYQANGCRQYVAYGPNYQQPKGGSGLAIAAMVCGILSIVLCCVFYLSGILAVAAVIMGIISLVKEFDGKGMAIAGIVTGGVGFFIMLVMIFQLIANIGMFA